MGAKVEFEYNVLNIVQNYMYMVRALLRDMFV